jgi:hypothetical protein
MWMGPNSKNKGLEDFAEKKTTGRGAHNVAGGNQRVLSCQPDGKITLDVVPVHIY